MSWLDKLLGKEKGYKQLDEAAEFKEFDVGAIALNAAIEAAKLTATQSGKISDQIAYVELLLQRTPGNKSYIENLKKLKSSAAASAAAASAAAASAAAAAAAAAASTAARDGSEGSVEGSVEGSEEDSVGSAFSNEGGKKSRYSRKLKSKYSRKSKSKYSRKSKSKSRYSRKSKSKYSRKY
jgi:hypothetical protein